MKTKWLKAFRSLKPATAIAGTVKYVQNICFNYWNGVRAHSSERMHLLQFTLSFIIFIWYFHVHVCECVCVIHTLCEHMRNNAIFSFNERIVGLIFISFFFFICISDVTLKIIPFILVGFHCFSYFLLRCFICSAEKIRISQAMGDEYSMVKITIYRNTHTRRLHRATFVHRFWEVRDRKKTNLQFDKRTNDFISIYHGAPANMIVNRFPVNCCQSIDLAIVHAFLSLLFGRQMSFYSLHIDVFFSPFRFEPFLRPYRIDSISVDNELRWTKEKGS